MKKWFLFQNDIFIAYAPNRLKARGWCCVGGTVYAESKNEIKVIRGNDKYIVIYKEVTI